MSRPNKIVPYIVVSILIGAVLSSQMPHRYVLSCDFSRNYSKPDPCYCPPTADCLNEVQVTTPWFGGYSRHNSDARIANMGQYRMQQLLVIGGVTALVLTVRALRARQGF